MATKAPQKGLEVRVKYTRAPDIREIAVDGIYGAISSSGDLFMAVFTERLELPEASILKVTRNDSGDGYSATDEAVSSGQNERTIHAVLHFDVALARKIRLWLDEQIGLYEDRSQ